MKFAPNRVILGFLLQYALISSALLLFAPIGRKTVASVGFIIFGLLTYWSKRNVYIDKKEHLMSPRACRILFAVLTPLVIAWWIFAQKSSIDQLPWLLVALAALFTLLITSNRFGGRSTQEAR